MNSLRPLRSPDEGETDESPVDELVRSSARAPEELTVASRDGLKLFARVWRPAAEAKATVVVVHGFGEHSSKYDHVARWICDAGMNAITYDLRGHGRSEGARGHFSRYSEMMDDFEAVLERAEEPRFLYAHSFGGQVVLLTGLERKLSVRGVFISAPWIRLAFEPPAWRVWLAAAMSQVWPSFTQRANLGPDRLSRDLAFINSLPHPEFLHRRISARAYFESVRAGEIIERRASEWTLPICLAQGDDDPVTSLVATRAFFERCSAKDKTLSVYPSYRHEIHNDLGREHVQKDAMAWFAKRLSSA